MNGGVICFTSLISSYKKDTYACRALLPKGDLIEKKQRLDPRLQYNRKLSPSPPSLYKKNMITNDESFPDTR
ncbi:hypothetical protein JHK85_010836 [Glycine max]|nr:hypothetical protein JHK85_010836 [Glycine max]